MSWPWVYESSQTKLKSPTILGKTSCSCSLRKWFLQNMPHLSYHASWICSLRGTNNIVSSQRFNGAPPTPRRVGPKLGRKQWVAPNTPSIWTAAAVDQGLAAKHIPHCYTHDFSSHSVCACCKGYILCAIYLMKRWYVS